MCIAVIKCCVSLGASLLGSVETRDYLAAWLGILLKESYIIKVEETRGVEVVQSKQHTHTPSLPTVCPLSHHIKLPCEVYKFRTSLIV